MNKKKDILAGNAMISTLVLNSIVNKVTDFTEQVERINRIEQLEKQLRFMIAVCLFEFIILIYLAVV